MNQMKIVSKIAAKLASKGKIKIIVKGHIHTDVLMKEVIKKEYNLLGKMKIESCLAYDR